MSRAFYLIPKVIAVAVMVTVAWFVYTNIQPTGDTAETVAPGGTDKTPWVSGYSLTVRDNPKGTSARDEETDTKETEEESNPATTGSTTNTIK